MKLKQEGKCALCGKPFAPGERPHVDHDHETKSVRALLHGVCNRNLASIEDPVFLKAALAYLAKHS